MTNDTHTIRIDVDTVLRQRLPQYRKYIPHSIIRWLEHIIRQDQMNEMLAINSGKRNSDFCRGVLEHLNITYSLHNADRLPPIGHRNIVFVSNHPLGGLDGMILIDMIAQRYGKNLKFVVNDLLMAIEPLNGIFLPVNKHGKQSRQSHDAIDEAFSGTDPIIVFPAGLVSRRGKKGIISDLQWQKTVINKCICFKRDIIPLYFSGSNSNFFYNFAKLRTCLGLKFNIEMVRLPAEVFRCRNAVFDIYAGQTVEWHTLRGGKEAQMQADALKRLVYDLKPDN